jgi:hypothetical protein
MSPLESPAAPRPDDQREVVAFLSRPDSYPGRSATVERVDTHCSSVFLVGDRAYKLKHALAFASLDYTTLERRERACWAELALNRRTAPDLYLGVMPVNRTPEGMLALDGRGTAIDWLVVMRRFAETDLFDRMADNGRLSVALMRWLSEEIARFHGGAECMPGFGGADGLRRAIAHNLEELLLRTGPHDGSAARALHAAAQLALDRVAPILDERRARGMVRRCHGDLRLANICLFGGRPTLFDCVEFSDEISCIDVLYDLAFLLMDLRQRGLGALADAVLGRYVEITGDRDGLQVLPLFLSVRAATRSYAVAASALRRTDPQVAVRLAAQAQSLLTLADAFLKETPPVG